MVKLEWFKYLNIRFETTGSKLVIIPLVYMAFSYIHKFSFDLLNDKEHHKSDLSI